MPDAVLTQRFTDHLVSDERDFKHLKETLDRLENNHLAHMEVDLRGINERVSAVSLKLETTSTNGIWLERIAVGSVSALLAWAIQRFV